MTARLRAIPGDEIPGDEIPGGNADGTARDRVPGPDPGPILDMLAGMLDGKIRQPAAWVEALAEADIAALAGVIATRCQGRSLDLRTAANLLVALAIRHEEPQVWPVLIMALGMPADGFFLPENTGWIDKARPDQWRALVAVLPAPIGQGPETDPSLPDRCLDRVVHTCAIHGRLRGVHRLIALGAPLSSPQGHGFPADLLRMRLNAHRVLEDGRLHPAADDPWIRIVDAMESRHGHLALLRHLEVRDHLAAFDQV